MATTLGERDLRMLPQFQPIGVDNTSTPTNENERTGTLGQDGGPPRE